MATSSDLKALGLALLAGDLAAAAPLLDAFTEANDTRRYDLINHLKDLQEGREQYAKGAADRHFRSPEERAYRQGEYHYRMWKRFSDGVEALLYYEIHGVPDLAFLKTVGGEIRAAEQARRYAEDKEKAARAAAAVAENPLEAGETYGGDDEPMGMLPGGDASYGRNVRRFRETRR